MSQTKFKNQSNCCDMCNSESSQLQDCSRCGIASHCSKECQVAAYPEHKHWCKMAFEQYPRDTTKGEKRILFSRRFGGACSLLMKQGHDQSRRGLIHAKCSHPLADYCGRRRTQDKRSIVLTWIPEGEELLALQRDSLGPTQPQRDEEGPGLLEQALEINESFVNATRPATTDEDIASKFCVVAFEEPGVQFLRVTQLFSYLGSAHGAHRAYEQMRREVRPSGSNLAKSITLEWDHRRNISTRENTNDKLQWLLYNAISPSFRRECSLAYQEKERTGDSSPWPGGALTPPLAMGFSMTEIPQQDGET